jgi:hypothetical protein
LGEARLAFVVSDRKEERLLLDGTQVPADGGSEPLALRAELIETYAKDTDAWGNVGDQAGGEMKHPCPAAQTESVDQATPADQNKIGVAIDFVHLAGVDPQLVGVDGFENYIRGEVLAEKISRRQPERMVTEIIVTGVDMPDFHGKQRVDEEMKAGADRLTRPFNRV